MNFYDNINNLASSFKNTDEYKEYLQLKEKILKISRMRYKLHI